MQKRRLMTVAALLAVLVLLTGAAMLPTIKLVINGREISSDVPPTITNGRTLVPVRMISESLGAKVEWDSATRTVIVKAPSSNNQSKVAALLGNTILPQTANEAVAVWAEGIMNCNGSLQYATYTDELRKEQLSLLEAQSWTTGWPGGWAERYEIKAEEGDPSEPTVLRWAVTFFGKSEVGQEVSESIRVRTRLNRHESMSQRWQITRVDYKRGLVIPLIMTALRDSPADQPGHGEEWFSAKWDTGAGSLAVEKNGFATLRVDNTRVLWDGSNSINVVPTDPKAVAEIITLRDERSVKVDKVPANGGAMLAGWVANGDGRVLTTVRLDSLGYWELRLVVDPSNVQSTVFAPSGASTYSLVKPVALGGTLTEPKIYFETISKQVANRYGLVEANIAGNAITWRIITEDMAISEAGAGTRMALLGNLLYVASPDATVKQVDISSGAMAQATEINKSLASFKANYASNPDYAVTPNLVAYNGELLVSWTPTVAREGQAQHVTLVQSLAVHDGQVIAEVRIASGQITAYKFGAMTTRLILDTAENRWMTFPTR